MSEPGNFIEEEVSSASNCVLPLEEFLEKVLALGYMVPMYQSAKSNSAAGVLGKPPQHKLVDWFEELKQKYPLSQKILLFFF